MTRTRRNRWLLPVMFTLAYGIREYIDHRGLSWGDAGRIALTFVIFSAAAFAVDWWIYGSVKPTTPEDTNDDAG